MSSNILIQLLIIFLSIAPFAIGGAQTLLPELYRQFVVNQPWLTSSQFATTVALAQIAPGPNMLVVSLLGWKVAGLPGLIVTTTALIGPTSVAAWYASRWMERLKNANWLNVVKVALAPVVIGLMLASGVITSQAANHDWVGYALTAATSVFVYFSSRNPLWLLGSGAIAGLLAHRFGLMAIGP